MRQKACSLFTKSNAVSVVDYAPIVRALEKMNINTALNIKRKFEMHILYLQATLTIYRNGTYMQSGRKARSEFRHWIQK